MADYEPDPGPFLFALLDALKLLETERDPTVLREAAEAIGSVAPDLAWALRKRARELATASDRSG